MKTNSAFTGPHTENPFWYQQLDLRQIRTLRGGQPIVDFDADDNCRIYVTTEKTMNFQDDMPLIPLDNIKDHYVLVFDMTSMQDANETCHYPEPVGEPLRLELNSTFHLEHVTEVIVLEERISLDAADMFGVVEKKTSQMDNIHLQQTFNRIPLLKDRYRGSFPSDCFPNIYKVTFAIVSTQPSIMQSEHWIMIANSRQVLYFADFLCHKEYSFLKQQYEQMMPEPLQSHPSVRRFYTIYSAFHFFKLRQDEITRIRHLNVLSFKSNYM